MAIKKKPQKKAPLPVNSSSSLTVVPVIPKGELLVLDEEELPIMGNFGRSVEVTYPKEFAMLDSMEVNQSAVFLQGKANIVTAIRTRIHKLGSKKFVVKKINSTHSRIWRVPDNTITRPGGKKASEKAAQTNKARKKGNGWGGYRGPKLTHKDGTPIVPSDKQIESAREQLEAVQSATQASKKNLHPTT